MDFTLQSKLYPPNHKTVFVIDHTPYFGISSDQPIEFDFLKSRLPGGYTPLGPLCKSLWTYSVEATIEYCRIVWDLFPTGKLIRFIASDTLAHILSTWNPQQQNTLHITNGMSLIGVPPAPPSPHSNMQDYTILHGLRAAVESLTEKTEDQVQKLASLNDGEKLLNRGRVICITSARDDDSIKRLEGIFMNVLKNQNQRTLETTDNLVIDYCHLIILNVAPINIELTVSSHPPINMMPQLTIEVHSIRAPHISNKLSTLILEHYDLASTTVTGIPMKEEQNASSSANYDVEIYHSKEAHTAMLKANALDSAAIRTIKDGLEYETATLKWCTPRGCTGNELHNCISIHRITPVDVNSRPSSCLINFLLNGRSVMLEMPRKLGGKITSHLLAAHGGEIFIHTLCTARSVLEDPPSISEGVGGRITDYRITDFGLLMRQNILVPVRPEIIGRRPLEKTKARLGRLTKYWPMTLSRSYIANMKNIFEPLPSLITKESITDEEVFTCKKVLFSFLAMESKMESLHAPMSAQKAKLRREDHYKATWSELEMMIKNNLHSKNHRLIYNCLLDCHKFDDDKVELDASIKDLDLYQESNRASVIRATTDSPMSPPPLTTLASGGNAPFAKMDSGKPKSLYDIFIDREEEKLRKRPPLPFHREGAPRFVKLYSHLKFDDEKDSGNNNAEEEKVIE